MNKGKVTLDMWLEEMDLEIDIEVSVEYYWDEAPEHGKYRQTDITSFEWDNSEYSKEGNLLIEEYVAENLEKDDIIQEIHEKTWNL